VTAVLDRPASTAPTTSTAPTGRALWTRWRAPLAVLAVLVLVPAVLAALGATRGGSLDPRSYAPDGSRAVATLLEDRDVPVRVVTDLPALRAGLGQDSTVVVPQPSALTRDELAAVGALDAVLVVLGAGADELDALGLPVRTADAELQVRAPGCPLPAAVRAGAALTGRTSYTAHDGVPALGCYAAGDGATLLVMPGGRTTLVGAADLLTNAELADDGNAALALGLLGAGDEVRWLLPAPGRAVSGDRPSLGDLLPAAVPLAVLQLGLAVALLALWRARGLGRVVPEPLPVVVRAAEAVEGRGRLYRAAGARDTAAEALRAGARDRLVRRLGLPPDAGRGAVVSGVAARAGRPAAEVDELLYGAGPVDDAALVRLADALDGLTP